MEDVYIQYGLLDCLIDMNLENPSSISKEYFRYAMREVEVKSLPIFLGSSKNVLPTTMKWANSGLGVDTCLDMVKLLGLSVSTTGDPDGLDTSEVPDDVPISLLHGSSFLEWWKMSFLIVLPITLV